MRAVRPLHNFFFKLRPPLTPTWRGLIHTGNDSFIRKNLTASIRTGKYSVENERDDHNGDADDDPHLKTSLHFKNFRNMGQNSFII